MESHIQNQQPGHNHHVHFGHQPPPPPPPSLSPHLNQLMHLQFTGHFDHYQHHQPPQQQQRTQIPMACPFTAASNIGVPATYRPSPQGHSANKHKEPMKTYNHDLLVMASHPGHQPPPPPPPQQQPPQQHLYGNSAQPGGQVGGNTARSTQCGKDGVLTKDCRQDNNFEERLCALVKAGVIRYLVNFVNHYEEFEKLGELIARIFNAICSEEKLIEIVV
ncbi:inactive histone-lysine N-methyltransferase 2E-like [Temnothorax curvispinosus]|uniref:Inactive histone-lysine N-methyltransferase 2E-like n=1 Tax=Temnothorax curvispinosus TaxID=300111 RepID=A0A6J1RBU0_9HYME|nr:inactive histone-lysine N-methyltransferase 2E-like [Temnothorax curvispinosus]